MRIDVQQRPSIEDVKARTSIVSVIGRNVQLQKRGHEHFGLCPFHNEKTPSFTVNESKAFFHCFGCGAHGDIFDYLNMAHGMELSEACEYLAIEAGMIADSYGNRRTLRKPIPKPAPDNSEAERIEQARAIWRETQPIEGTPAETYLRHRGIYKVSAPSLRFHPGLWHSEARQNFPAMVAAVQRFPGQDIRGVHRTYLRPDGMGKAPVEKPKMMRGPCAGGAVHLVPHGPELVIGEGIETCLSVLQETGKPTWACLSATGIEKVILPDDVETVIIAADRDENKRGELAARKAAERFQREGYKIRIALPPVGKDFNDTLLQSQNVVSLDTRRVANG